MQLGRYGRNPGWWLLGLVAFVYGVGGAFLGGMVSEGTANAWWWWGSMLLGLGFLAFMVVPFILWLTGGARRPVADKTRV